MGDRVCREYRAGDLVRCPGPGRHRAHCDAPLLEVGLGCRARACVGATDTPGPHTVKKCRVCGSLVRIEVWQVGEGAA
jgi:hypothetical protein